MSENRPVATPAKRQVDNILKGAEQAMLASAPLPNAPGIAFQRSTSGEFHMAQRDAVFPAGRHDLYTSQTYSAAIRSDGLLFVSGHVGSRSDGAPEPDFEAQVRLAFANLEATLQAGGCGLDDIVDVTTFHTDPENQFGTVMTVKNEVFPEAPYPNWTAIGVNWLAGFDFEIKVIARIPG